MPDDSSAILLFDGETHSVVQQVRYVVLSACSTQTMQAAYVANNLSPMHSRKLKSTQLNCSVQFSFPLCIEPATIRRQNWRSSHVLHNRDTLLWIDQSMQCLSLGENRRRAVTTDDGRRPFLTVKYLRWTSPVIAARCRFNAQRKAELNRTIQFSTVECSFHCALGFSCCGWLVGLICCTGDV